MLTLGETMASLRSSGPLRLGGPLHLSIAGAESNVAIGLARLGHQASWTGVVGADELGELIVRTLRAEGVAVSTARVEDAPTGIILFEHRLADITRVQYRRAGSAGSRLSPADADDAFAAGPPAVLHYTGVTPALGEDPRQAVTHAAALARAAGSLCSFNVNYRAALWPQHEAAAVISSLAAGADLVVAAADELFLAVPAPGGPSDRGGSRDEPGQARILLESGTGEVLVTAGAAGATLYRPDGTWQQPAAHVLAADSVGAGDAFVAGYLSGLLDGLAPQERLARATTTAAFGVAAVGDWEGLPTRAELPLLASGPGATLR